MTAHVKEPALSTPSKRLLGDYIKMYDKTLAPERCETLIARFEAARDLHERKREGDSATTGYHFVELNVSAHWPDVLAEIGGVLHTAITRYYNSLEIKHFWPDRPVTEAIRLKRYVPNTGEQFAPHVDVMDDTACRRFLTAILYLNVPGGGETLFPDLGLAVPPEPGRMIVFPPLWTFVHAGMPPKDRPKYILHSYLLYPPPERRAD